VSKTKRIDKLTPEQAARMPEWRDKWIAIGLRTGPADRPAFEKHVRACYRAAKLEEPKRIVWVQSPFVLAFAAPAASLALEWRKNKQVPASVDAVHDAVRGAVHGAVRGAVGGAVDGAVHDAVHDAVRGAVGGAVRGAVVSAIQRSWYYYFGGQLWPGWVSWASYFTDCCDLDIGPELYVASHAYAGTVESACWWWPHRDFVMVCERPREIHRDGNGRLHNPFGKAIVWPDGWGLYRIHGTDVPANVIEDPESVTVASIDAEANAEVRRIMVERYGTERFVKDADAQVIHEEEVDGLPARLYRRDFPDGTWALAVSVRNGTPEPDGTRREFWLRPHPELRPLPDPDDPNGELGEPQELTCRAAIASTYGKRAEDYMPLERT